MYRVAEYTESEGADIEALSPVDVGGNDGMLMSSGEDGALYKECTMESSTPWLSRCIFSPDDGEGVEAAAGGLEDGGVD